MAGPVAAKINLPKDGGNVGPVLRTLVFKRGANWEHAHRFALSEQPLELTHVVSCLAQATAITGPQNGTSTGFFWLHVPTAISGKKIRLSKLQVSTQQGTTATGITAPRIAFSRFTFTGTASGGAITETLIDTANGVSVGDIRSAVTGLTVSLVGVMGVAPFGGALTAVGAYPTYYQHDLINERSDDEWWVFAPGQGLVAWQDTAGSATETRVANIAVQWEDIDTA